MPQKLKSQRATPPRDLLCRANDAIIIILAVNERIVANDAIIIILAVNERIVCATDSRADNSLVLYRKNCAKTAILPQELQFNALSSSNRLTCWIAGESKVRMGNAGSSYYT